MRIVAVSDVHGFYDQMIEALNKVNFDKDKDLFISCGDNLDRGPQPKEVIDFLKSLPNKVLIKGNHETLFEDACRRKYFGNHDYHNGTVDTFAKLAKYNHSSAKYFDDVLAVYKPLLDEMVPYYETEHYIFVHSWIAYEDWCDEYNPKWREAHTCDWEKAGWPNPFHLATKGLNQTGKTIVHGHWHNSCGWVAKGVGTDFGTDACFDICEHDGCIGLDACTVYSKKVNTLVIEEG